MRDSRQLQKAFCKYSSFVLRARVLSEHQEKAFYSDLLEVAREQIYALKVIQIFFVNVRGVRIPDKVSLYVPSKMTSAYLSLERDGEYLLTGYIGYTGNLRMNLCDWHKKWADVTSLERRGLRGQYARNCRRHNDIFS